VLTADEVREWPPVLVTDGRSGIGCLACPEGSMGVAWSSPRRGQDNRR
jgi:hypothetical protein